jgi:TrkA domain protein
MARITETRLPGVGVRQEFVSTSGQRIAVVSHRSGRRELALYRGDDPDAYATVLELDAEDTAVLAEILGAPQVAAAAHAMQRLEGLVLDWLRVESASPAAGTTIGAGRYRTRTGASIVAVIRGEETLAAPGPEFELRGGDVVVAVGRAEGLEQLGSLLGR